MSDSFSFLQQRRVLLGGRFDPPHLGHRKVVQELVERLGVKEVWVIPSGNPPHKAAVASIQDRLELVRLNFEGLSRVVICELECEQARVFSDRPNYSLHTLQTLRPSFHQAQWTFALGVDQFLALESWYGFPDLLGFCHWLVIERRGWSSESQQQCGVQLRRWQERGWIRNRAGDGAGWSILNFRGERVLETYLDFISVDAPPLSSSQVRADLEASSSILSSFHLGLQESVWEYLKKHRLYGI